MKPQVLYGRCVNEDEFVPNDHRFRMGKNDEMIEQINDNTSLIIVGTFIPNIPFFYTGANSPLYQKLDLKYNTYAFTQCKNNIMNHQDNPREYIEELKHRLSEIGLVLFDAIKYANVYDVNGSSDENIESAVIDEEMLNLLIEIQNNHNPNQNITIVSASGFAKLVLDNRGIINYYPKYGLIGKYNNHANENWGIILNDYL